MKQIANVKRNFTAYLIVILGAKLSNIKNNLLMISGSVALNVFLAAQLLSFHVWPMLVRYIGQQSAHVIVRLFETTATLQTLIRPQDYG